MLTQHWLFISELGDNYGHIAPALYIANSLAKRGAKITFIVPSLTRFYALATMACEFNVYQAPLNIFRKTKANALPQSYSESLLLHGYSQPEALSVAIKAWRMLFSQLQPDITFFDYAPTALLAARAFSFKKVMFGNGYCVPPQRCARLPLLGRIATPERMNLADQQVLAAVNIALNNNHDKPLTSLDEIAASDLQLLKTTPEFDGYRERRTTEKYLGFLPVGGGHKQAQWPKVAGKKKVFAYLSTRFPFAQALIQWLQANFIGHVFVTGNKAQELTALSNATFTVTAQAYDMATVLEGCDFVVCHAGSGTVARSLLAARPVICIPLQSEQQQTAEQAAALGVGAFIPPASTWEQWLPAIQQALTTQLPALQKSCLDFLPRYYKEYAVQDPCEHVLQLCLALLNQR